jgi:hypothetical protein
VLVAAGGHRRSVGAVDSLPVDGLAAVVVRHNQYRGMAAYTPALPRPGAPGKRATVRLLGGYVASPRAW